MKIEPFGQGLRCGIAMLSILKKSTFGMEWYATMTEHWPRVLLKLELKLTNLRKLQKALRKLEEWHEENLFRRKSILVAIGSLPSEPRTQVLLDHAYIREHRHTFRLRFYAGPILEWS